MIERKCDKCGVLIKVDNHFFPAIYSKFRVNDYEKTNYFNMDLCSKCNQKLKEWIKEKDNKVSGPKDSIKNHLSSLFKRFW